MKPQIARLYEQSTYRVTSQRKSTITNGDELQLYAYRGPRHSAAVLFQCLKADLVQRFPELQRYASKDAVIDLKSQVLEAVEAAMGHWKREREGAISGSSRALPICWPDA